MKKKAKANKNTIEISTLDGSAFGGMMLSFLGHPVFKRSWNSGLWEKDKIELCKMFLELNDKLRYKFQDEEVNYVKEVLSSMVTINGNQR